MTRLYFKFLTMKRVFLAVFLLMITGLSIHAQSDKRKKEYNLGKMTLAIQGYDPVSYFDGQAEKGSAANAVVYEGVTYYFSSTAHKEIFKADPAKYEPQYGGWCAYAMGKTGDKIEVDPETFKVLNGKLLLFYNKYFNNTLKSWNKDEKNLNASADMNWKKFYH